jgi:hypothetical protein
LGLLVSQGINVLVGTATANIVVGVVLFGATFWGIWHWAQRAGLVWPKWVLVVLAGTGALGSVQLAITSTPLRLIPAAFSLAAFVVLVRAWPPREIPTAAARDGVET